MSLPLESPRFSFLALSAVAANYADDKRQMKEKGDAVLNLTTENKPNCQNSQPYAIIKLLKYTVQRQKTTIKLNIYKQKTSTFAIALVHIPHPLLVIKRESGANPEQTRYCKSYATFQRILWSLSFRMGRLLETGISQETYHA